MTGFRKSTLTSGAQSPFRLNARDQALYTNVGLEQEVEKAPHNQIFENGEAPMPNNGYNPFNGDIYSFDDEQRKDLSGYISSEQADVEFDAEGTPVDSIDYSTQAEAPEFHRTNVFKNYGAASQMSTPQELGLDGEDEDDAEVEDESVYFMPNFGNSRYAQAVNNVEGDGEFGAFGATLITPTSTASKTASTASKTASTASKTTSTASKTTSTASKTASTASKTASTESKTSLLQNLVNRNRIVPKTTTTVLEKASVDPRRVASLTAALKKASIDNRAANREVVATLSSEEVEPTVFEFEDQADIEALETLIEIYNTEASRYVSNSIDTAEQMQQLLGNGQDVDASSSASYVDQMNSRIESIVELYDELAKYLSFKSGFRTLNVELQEISNLEVSDPIKAVLGTIVKGIDITRNPTFKMEPVSTVNPDVFRITPIPYRSSGPTRENQVISLERTYGQLKNLAKQSRNASFISLDDAVSQLITNYTTEYYAEDLEPFANALVETVDYVNNGFPISLFNDEIFAPIKSNNTRRANELFLALVDIKENHPDGADSSELSNLIDRAAFILDPENYPSVVETEADLQTLIGMVDGLLVLFRTPSLEEKFGRRIVVNIPRPTEEALPPPGFSDPNIGAAVITYLANGFVASDSTGVHIIGRVEGGSVRELQDIMVDDEVYYVTLPLTPIEEVFVYDSDNQLVDTDTLNSVRMAILEEYGEEAEDPKDSSTEDFSGEANAEEDVNTDSAPKPSPKSSMTPWIIGGSAVAVLAGAFIWHKNKQKTTN